MDIPRFLLIVFLIIALATVPGTSAVPTATMDTIPTVENAKGKETPMPTQPAYEPGVLLASVTTQEEAQQIASLYGITLVSVTGTLAKFTTDQDLATVIELGQKNDWPLLTPNYYRQLYIP